MITIKFWLIVAFLPLCYNNNVVAPNLAIERGCLRGFTYLISCFHRSWYSQLLYLQMARWRRQRHQPADALPFKKRRTPTSWHSQVFVFVLTHLSHFLAVAIITYSNSYFKYSLLPYIQLLYVKFIQTEGHADQLQENLHTSVYQQ